MANGLAFYNKKFMVIKVDKELIAESITRIIMTNPGERVGQPYFGVGLRNMLFNQIDDDFTAHLETVIQDQCTQYEPRATITKVNVDNLPDENKVSVSLTFVINGDPPTSTNILTYDFKLD